MEGIERRTRFDRSELGAPARFGRRPVHGETPPRGRARGPGGCIGQAWTVAETLRAWRSLPPQRAPQMTALSLDTSKKTLNSCNLRSSVASDSAFGTVLKGQFQVRIRRSSRLGFGSAG